MTETEFLAKDGLMYTIRIDDCGELIEVSEGSESLGSISLRYEEGDPPYQADNFHITHLELDAPPRKGIGRRCLLLHKETFGATITAGRADGSRSDDGSHLTGDGPQFIARMRFEGTVVPLEPPFDDDY